MVPPSLEVRLLDFTLQCCFVAFYAFGRSTDVLLLFNFFQKLTFNELDYLRDNFRTILGFIQSSKINVGEVEESFRARTYRAKSLIHIFNQATEYLKALMKDDSTIFPAIIFLEYLLQDQKDFPAHFLDGVEGCGLEYEKEIRKTFYSLIKYLIRYSQNLLSKDVK